MVGTLSKTNKHSSFWLGNAQSFQNDKNVKISKSRKLSTKYKIRRPEEIQSVYKKLKTIQAKAARLKWYQKRSRFYKDNNIFKNNSRQFYRSIGKSQIKINKAPSEEEIRSFWEKIWSGRKTHNSQTPCIEKLRKEYEALKQ